MTAVGAHLVGGIVAEDAEAAFRLQAEYLAGRASRFTDGETGERAQWIWWQIDKLTALPGITMGEPQTNPETGNPDYSVFPGLVVTPGVKIPPGALGYVTAAIESYGVFCRLREEGVIPKGVRFQVSIPTPFAVVVAWAPPGQQMNLWQPFKDALFAEVTAIQEEIPAADLAIQWDVAVEIGHLEGVFPATEELAGFDHIVRELEACARTVEPPVQRGLHFCYGDYKHRHFTAPADLGLIVKLANAVNALVPVDFVHMPADRLNAQQDAYFAPLADLEHQGELALGVVDYENDPDVMAAVTTAADSAEKTYRVATECGMSRLGERGEEVIINDLLRAHVVLSWPLEGPVEGSLWSSRT